MHKIKHSQNGKPFTVEVKSARRTVNKPEASSSLWAGIDLASVSEKVGEEMAARETAASGSETAIHR